MFKWNKTWRRLVSIGIATLFLFVVGTGAFAQDDGGEAPAEETTALVEEASVLTADEVQFNLDMTWILIAGFLVFFMQAGFAMLEGGMIRQTGVVNSMAENFMDACVTGILFFIVGFGIAFGSTENSLFFPGIEFALGGIDGTGDGDGVVFVNFFFQFAFAGAAATIATGAMAERTDFKGKLLYSAVVGAIIYPIVVFWTWGGGWLTDLGFVDFAGSGIVHMTGGIIALIGAMVVGPRVGREWGNPPKPHNMFLATLGTFILWFGWYGFNVGSTLGAGSVNALGLVAVNTTLAACAGALAAMTFMYVRTGKWDLPFILNGSLAGLVGITAGCAFVSPVGALIIGIAAGVVVVISVSVVESLKIDDAVSAFSVHGACGALGVLGVGFLGVEGLVGENYGLLLGGGADLIISQITGIVAIAAWTSVTSVVLFVGIKSVGLLRMPAKADEIGIDAYEHGASVWPDILPYDEAPATGD
ncbi:MAG: ammonium transporter [Aggregatilineales bacterium]